MIKKILFFLIILFNSGCATTYYIKQTLDNGALACEGDTCDTYTTTHCYNYGCFSNRHQPLLVFIDNIDGIEYYDGLVFEVPSNLEVVKNGLYKYTSVNNAQKTVPYISFVNKNNQRKNN